MVAQRLIFLPDPLNLSRRRPDLSLLLFDLFVERTAQGFHQPMLRFVHQRQLFFGLLAKLGDPRFVLDVRGPERRVLVPQALNQLTVFEETLLELLEPSVFGDNALFEGGTILGCVSHAARIDIGPVRA